MSLERFDFSVVRYVPDPAREEAVNLGVLVVSDSKSASASMFLRGFLGKIRSLDPTVNKKFVGDYITSLQERTGSSYQAELAGHQDEYINNSAQLAVLSSTLRNVFQVSEPRAYRAESLQSAARELFMDFVAPNRKGHVMQQGMTRAQMRKVIRRTIRDWVRARNGEIRIKENELERATRAQHHADFWVQNGHTLAALIAIPANSEERSYAWAVRDSVPTIAHEFQELYPGFKAVAIFPPRTDVVDETAFVKETAEYLKLQDGVLVAYADALSEVRAKILPDPKSAA